MENTTNTKTVNEFYAFVIDRYITTCKQIEDALTDMKAAFGDYEAHTKAFERVTALQDEREKYMHARDILSIFRNLE